MLVIAGLSVIAFDAVRRVSQNRFAPNGRLFAKPVKRPGYPKQQADEYLCEIEQHLRGLREGDPVSIMLLYVDHDGEPTTTAFVEQFFPFALVRPIRALQLDDTLPRPQQNVAVNAYVDYLEREAVELRRRADRVRERTHVHNLSPLLLPVRNFHSRHHDAFLKRLFDGLGRTPDVAALLEAEIAGFVARHPRIHPPGENHTCHSDGSLYFKSPGKARHGYYRHEAGKGHGPACLLNARARLGGSYDHAFHYDCRPVRSLLPRYPNCHDQPTPPKENHVNIAPNDFVIGSGTADGRG